MDADDKIQLNGFEDWYTAILLLPNQSAAIRRVLFNQKKALRDEWMACRPMTDSYNYECDENGRVKYATKKEE